MTDNDPSAQDRHTPEPGTPEQPNPEAHTGSSEREDTERYREGGQGTDEFRYPPRTPIGDYAQGGYPTSPHTQSGYTAYSLGPTQSSPERRGMPGRLVAGVALLALLVGGSGRRDRLSRGGHGYGVVRAERTQPAAASGQTDR